MIPHFPGADAVDLVIDVIELLRSFPDRCDERLAAVVGGHRVVGTVMVGPDMLVLAFEREVYALVVLHDFGLGLLLLS